MNYVDFDIIKNALSSIDYYQPTFDDVLKYAADIGKIDLYFPLKEYVRLVTSLVFNDRTFDMPGDRDKEGRPMFQIAGIRIYCISEEEGVGDGFDDGGHGGALPLKRKRARSSLYGPKLAIAPPPGTIAFPPNPATPTAASRFAGLMVIPPFQTAPAPVPTE